MKTINLFFLFMLSCVLVVNTNAAIPNIDNSDYYIAMSFDGNDHDKDDILAMPMALALVGEACLQDKLVHVDFSNHIWGDIAQSVTRMRQSNTGAVDRWNHDASIMFEARIASQLNAAKANFKQKANMAFNQNTRIYYACGGPMHVPYLCVTEVPTAQRNNITCISHSKWNDNHKHGNSKTWSALANTGVKTVARGVIGNQNQTAFNQSEGSWSWLNQMGGKYSWLFSRNFKSSFDASDAGMTWYIITGRGDKKAGMANVKDFFQKYNCGTTPPVEYTINASVGSGNGSITPSGNVKVNEGGNKTFTISAAAGSTIESVVVDGVDQGAIGTYTFSNVTSNHTIVANFSGSSTSTITITDVQTDCNAAGDTRNKIFFSVTGGATPTANKGTIVNKGSGNWLLRHIGTPSGSTTNYTITAGGDSETVSVTAADCGGGTPTVTITVTNVVTDCNASGKARNVIFFTVDGSSATPTVNKGDVLADGANWKVRHVNVAFGSTTNYTISVAGVSKTESVTAVSSCAKFSQGITSDATPMVFPNPATDVVNVAAADGSVVTIYNMQGQRVYNNSNANGLLKISSSEIGGQGMYLINVNGLTSQIVIK